MKFKCACGYEFFASNKSEAGKHLRLKREHIPCFDFEEVEQ